MGSKAPSSLREETGQEPPPPQLHQHHHHQQQQYQQQRGTSLYLRKDVQYLRQGVAALLALTLAHEGATTCYYDSVQNGRRRQQEVTVIAVTAFRVALATAVALTAAKDFHARYTRQAGERTARNWLPFWAVVFAATLLNLRLGDAITASGVLAVVFAAVATVLKIVECATMKDRVNAYVQTTTEMDSSLWGALSFAWVTPLINTGHARTLDAADVPALGDPDSTAVLASRLHALLYPSRPVTTTAAVTSATTVLTNRDVWAAAARLVKWELISLNLFTGVHGALTNVPMIGLYYVVRFLGSTHEEQDADPEHVRTFWLPLLIFSQILTALLDVACTFRCRRLQSRVRAAFGAIVFDKAMECDMNTVATQQSTGELTNLLSVDVEELMHFFEDSHMVAHSVIRMGVCIALLTRALGWAALGGVAVLALGVMASSRVWSGLNAARIALMGHKDKRMTRFQEILAGIKVVKLNAWGTQFGERVSQLRATEMNSLRSFWTYIACLYSMWDSLPTFVGITAFLLYTHAFDHNLSPWTAFYAFALFNNLRFPMMRIPDTISNFASSNVTMHRIAAFLSRPNVEGRRHALRSTSSGEEPPLVAGEVRMRNAFLAWPAMTHEEDACDDHDENREDDTAQSNSKRSPGVGAWLARLLPWSQFRYTSVSGSTSQEGDEGDDIEMQARASTTPPSTTTTTTTTITTTTVLRDLTLDIPPGSLVCVVGPTGSGKSSLLEALLGEAKTVGGDWAVGGDVAYVNQKAWIRNATVRDNILFGKPMDAERYNKVIQACSLAHDLSILANGDLTEIGERGVNLSGGQQQRVNLARAVYHNADIFLLDDVLSAVDAHVGEHLFHECILGEMRDSTRILATHQLALTLPHADLVVILDNDGRIAHSSSGQELVALAMAASSRASALMTPMEPTDGKAESHSLSEPEPESEPELELDPVAATAVGRPTKSAMLKAPFMQEVLAHIASTSPSTSRANSPRKSGVDVAVVPLEPPNTAHGASTESKQDNDGMLVEEEERAEGAVSLATCASYCRSMGGYRAAAVLLGLFAITEVFIMFQSFALAHWTTAIETKRNSTQALFVYVGICVGVIAVVACRSVAIFLASLRASQTIHDNMLASVLRAPLAWFESTPTGRILNRFSSDLAHIDTELMDHIGDTTACASAVILCVVVIVAAVPWLIILLVPICATCGHLASKYLAATRDLKRLESVQKSPVYAHFSESLTGASTVRAFDQGVQFAKEFNERCDTRNASYFILGACDVWMDTRAQLISAVTTSCVAIYLVFNAQHQDPATGGVALLYLLSTVGALLWGIRCFANVQLGLSCVERTDEYSCLEQEPPASVPDHAPSVAWPEQGRIEFQNLWMRYPSNLETAVLKGVTMDIPGGTRVGIVGRTGAGKSSLLSAIFRLVEPDAGSAIVIDGVNVLGDFGLADLRSRLAIVPQDPVLFQGTIRSNMDPFDEYNDEALWAALRQAHLAPAITALEGGLSAEVTEHGGNFSVGERQLLCMARAILKQSRVLIMDEATANVDPETDGLIQETVRHSLGECTVLCIAHRLHTVAYYDRVVVMDDGRVAEYDTPAALLQREDGAFRALCERSGNLEQLMQLAGSATRPA